MDHSLTVLPGQKGDLACNSCFMDSMCDSRKCSNYFNDPLNLELGCYGESRKMPAMCPANRIAVTGTGTNRKSGRGLCSEGNGCESGRCEFRRSWYIGNAIEIGECWDASVGQSPLFYTFDTP